jgi:hypothetical protein
MCVRVGLSISVPEEASIGPKRPLTAAPPPSSPKFTWKTSEFASI